MTVNATQSAIDEPRKSRAVTVSVSNVKKYFGPTRALDGCSFSARAGEIHAVVGGNGCGKSTLAKVVSGVLPIDSGSVSVLGEAPSTPAESRALGIATVYQEVLVADESTVVDNLFMGTDALFSSTVSGEEKVRRAAEMMRELAGEPIDPQALAGTLPLALKQWITIGRALLSRPKVLILDESSAALDFDGTERLFAKMRELRDAGSTILIVTHRIAELITISDRATVMRDGRDVGVLEGSDITEKNLIALMTGENQDDTPSDHRAPQPTEKTSALRVRDLVVWPGAAPFDFDLYRGEIVGIAGLDGQGQDEFVRIVAGVKHAAHGRPYYLTREEEFTPINSLRDAMAGEIAYVSGDRKREGIFASLSIFENMVMPLFRAKGRGGFIDWNTLGAIFGKQAEDLFIKFGARSDKITSLSGGNQQKALFARALGSDAQIVLMDDPMRGVDIGTKLEVYDLVREEARNGRTFLWYTTETEELDNCDHIYVFKNGRIVANLRRDELTEEKIIQSSFGDAA